MKNKLPALTAVALLAVGAILGFRSLQRGDQVRSNTAPTASTGEPATAPALPTAGDQLMVQARLALERRVSVTARIRYQAALNGRSLAGFGGYWQQGRGDSMHMRFELRVNHEDTSLLQVSDGRFIWSDQRVPAGRTITRLDLGKVRSESKHDDEEFEDLGSGRIRIAPPEPDLANRTGGLPKLLMVLSDCFAFQAPQSRRGTPAQPLEGLPASLPVFAVVGRWKPDVLAHFVPEGKGLEALTERLPQEVLLLFGQADLFPYRIESRQLFPAPAAAATPEPSAAFQLSSDPLMLLELSAVSFDSQVPAGQFDYAPGQENWNDLTAEYIDALKQEREKRMARRQTTLPR